MYPSRQSYRLFLRGIEAFCKVSPLFGTVFPACFCGFHATILADTISRESLAVRTQIHRRLERDTDIGVVHNLVDPIKDELAKLGGQTYAK